MKCVLCVCVCLSVCCVSVIDLAGLVEHQVQKRAETPPTQLHVPPFRTAYSHTQSLWGQRSKIHQHNTTIERGNTANQDRLHTCTYNIYICVYSSIELTTKASDNTCTVCAMCEANQTGNGFLVYNCMHTSMIDGRCGFLTPASSTQGVSGQRTM